MTRRILWMIVIWGCLITYRELYQAFGIYPQWSWQRVLAEVIGVVFALCALELYAKKVFQ